MAEFLIDLTDATEFTGIEVQPSGVYPVKITAFGDHIKADKAEGEEATSVRVDGTVIEGAHKGEGMSLFLGKDGSKKGNKSKWLGFGLSLGFPREKLKKVKFTDKTTIGKTIYVKVSTPPELYAAYQAGEDVDLNGVKKQPVTKAIYDTWLAMHKKTMNGGSKTPTETAAPEGGEAEGASDATDLTLE